MVHLLNSSLVPETVIELLFSYSETPLVFRRRTGSALLPQLTQWSEHTNNECISYSAADIDEASIECLLTNSNGHETDRKVGFHRNWKGPRVLVNKLHLPRGSGHLR